jgi:hypothetical protein
LSTFHILHQRRPREFAFGVSIESHVAGRGVPVRKSNKALGAVAFEVEMAAIIVPELKQKLEMLLTHSRLRDWTALAGALQVSPATIRGWIHDDRGRERGSIPQARFPMLETLFAELLIGHDPQRVRALLLGSATQLAGEIRAAATPLLTTLIESTAVREGIAVIRRNDETGLVEIDDAPTDRPFMPLGQYFRIVFPAAAGFDHALVLQNAGQSWGSVPHAVHDGAVLVPGTKAHGEPAFMRERHHRGLHRFVCVRTSTPPDASLSDYPKEGIALDKSALENIAFFYGRLPAESRLCHLIELRIDEAE